MSFGGLTMKHVRPILVLCGAAALAGAPDAADAFEFQAAPAPAEVTSLSAPQQNLFMQEFKSYSLTMPLSGETDSSGHVAEYGNSIPIPGPGIDLPAPAWAYSPASSAFGANYGRNFAQ